MIKILTSLVVVASAIIAFFIPFLKRKNQVLEIKNETLEEENKSNNFLIKSVKNAEEIKAKNSKLSKSDLISGL